ncbi:MAG: hypothetical protein P1P72_05255 [ANME-2 cluster archaeon]|nr:hypothetical protein [ANME-2 cluster archaeon]
MKNKILALLTFIILTFLITVADASVLIDSFRHESNLCTDGCHTRFPYGTEDEICGNCHSYGLNVPILESRHNPKICTGCHQVRDKQTFHMTHRDVTCDTKCHTLQGTKVNTPKIIISKCESCHTMKIHTLHENKISELCSTCHGSAVSAKTNVISSSTEFSINLDSNYQRFTLYEIFKGLLSE